MDGWIGQSEDEILVTKARQFRKIVTRRSQSHSLPAADGVGEDVAVGVFDVRSRGQSTGEAIDQFFGGTGVDLASLLGDEEA